MQPFKVFIEGDRVRFTIGVQTFSLDWHPEDEPGKTAQEHREWMVKMLTHALTKLAGQ